MAVTAEIEAVRDVVISYLLLIAAVAEAGGTERDDEPSGMREDELLAFETRSGNYAMRKHVGR